MLAVKNCILVNNNLCGKLALSLQLPTTSDERLEVTLVLFFIPDFNLLSWKLDNFTFKVLNDTLIVSCENIKWFLILGQ